MENIYFTTAHHQEIEHKLDVYEKLDLKTISIAEFSNLSKLVIIFQAFKPESKAMVAKERKTLRRKTKTLELYLMLDYERIMQGSDQENLQHIKEVFVKGCETFLKPMRGFRWEEFESKVREALAN